MIFKSDFHGFKLQVAKELYINGDTKFLLRKIKKGDKAAMVQLAMLYMPDIILHVEREISGYSHDHRHSAKITTTELIDIAIAGFINLVEQYINSTDYTESYKFNDDDEDIFREKFKQGIDDCIDPAIKKAGKYNLAFGDSYKLPKNVAMLNKLNRLLTEKQKIITARLAEYSQLIESRIKNKDIFTKDHNLHLEIQYFTKDNGNPIHSYYGGRCEIFESEITDWVDPCMPFIPELDDPCCYLLHDLIDHSRIGKKLFKIDSIWFDITLDDQNFVKRKEFI